MAKTSKIFITILATVSLFGFTRLSYAIDGLDINTAVINFVESVNKGNYDEALKMTLGAESDLQKVLELNKIFGMIEISDIATPEEAKSFESCSTTSDKCIVVGVDSDYFRNNETDVAKIFYNINLEFGGKGLLLVYFPGKESTGEVTDSKIAAVIFVVMKEGNFVGFTKAESHFAEYLKTLETK